MVEKPYLDLKDDAKRKLDKNNEVKMTIYNALPHIEFKRVSVKP